MIGICDKKRPWGRFFIGVFVFIGAICAEGARERFLFSPPDVFAVCAKLAKITGCYLHHALKDKGHLISSKQARSYGSSWRVCISRIIDVDDFNADDMPAEIVEAWGRVCEVLDDYSKSHHNSLVSLEEKIVSDVLLLISAADFASAGIGSSDNKNMDSYGVRAGLNLIKNGTMCEWLGVRYGRVLPKQHTPKVGLNLRNVTHHLSYCDESEVEVVWRKGVSERGRRPSFNLMIIPWPFEVHSHYICDSKRASSSSRVGYFDYSPEVDVEASTQRILRLIEEAVKSRGHEVDLVVLPECALSEEEWGVLCSRVSGLGVSLLSGVYSPGKDGELSTNSVRLRTPGSPEDSLIQYKHHRWKIDRNQIVNYSLGGTLSLGKEWWENIKIDRRSVSFFAFDKSLVICPLVCEDLARQDPVADIVRSVGPNLVVALLMDGPQLPGRWSARYASVLADDPGSSVLTVSSLGMVKLSSPPEGFVSRATVASWKQANGYFKEIVLPEGRAAVVLNLQFDGELEMTVDGRVDREDSSIPVLSGVHYVGDVSSVVEVENG